MKDAATARRDDDELTSTDLIRCGGRIPWIRQRRFPEQLAILLVECAELPVEIRGCDKHQTTGGCDRATIVLASRILHAFLSEFGIFAEWNLPGVFSGGQIDR